MKALRLLAAPLAVFALTVSAAALAHDPSEKVTVLQDEAAEKRAR